MLTFARQAALVAFGGFVIGCLTSVGQGVLPFALSPLANSAGAWSLAAFALTLGNREPRRGVILGVAALASMLAGYVVTSTVRGFPVGSSLLLFWGLASVVVGPVLGVGAAWVRGSSPIRISAGGAAIAGILVGEGAYGLTLIADSTPAGYWAMQIASGSGSCWRSRCGALDVSGQRPSVRRSPLSSAAFYVAYSADLTSLV